MFLEVKKIDVKNNKMHQLPQELLKHIISFIIGHSDDIFPNTQITINNHIKFIATLQSISTQINYNPGMMQYFDDFWLGVAKTCFCTGSSTEQDEKLLNILRNNSKKGLKRKILLVRYVLKLTEVQRNELKIVVLGDCGVGKSNIILRFVIDKFIDEYDPTIEDIYKKKIDMGRYQVNLDIAELANQESHDCFRWEVYCLRSGDCFIIVSSLDNPSTDPFDCFFHKIIRNNDRDIQGMQIVFVINKMDLIDHHGEALLKLKEEINKTIQNRKLTNTIIIECSAKTSLNITYLFEKCVLRMLHGHDDYLKAIENVCNYDSDYLRKFRKDIKKESRNCIMQ